MNARQTAVAVSKRKSTNKRKASHDGPRIDRDKTNATASIKGEPFEKYYAVLNTLCQKKGLAAPVYSYTEEGGQGFKCRVFIPGTDIDITGAACVGKKRSRAAAAALVLAEEDSELNSKTPPSKKFAALLDRHCLARGLAKPMYSYTEVGGQGFKCHVSIPGTDIDITGAMCVGKKRARGAAAALVLVLAEEDSEVNSQPPPSKKRAVTIPAKKQNDGAAATVKLSVDMGDPGASAGTGAGMGPGTGASPALAMAPLVAATAAATAPRATGEDFSKLTVVKLRARLKKHGLDQKGKKQVLVARLRAFVHATST